MTGLRTVQKHGLRVPYRYVEGPHAGAAAVKRDETAVNGGVEPVSVEDGLARALATRLRHGVVPLGELELENVTRIGLHAVGGECQILAADDNGDHFVDRRGGRRVNCSRVRVFPLPEVLEAR